MSDFKNEKPTRKMKMVPDQSLRYPNVPGSNGGFSRDETSSIYVDSEAILEERNARPPAPPKATAPKLKPSRELEQTPVAVPKAQVLRVPKPKLNRD